MAVAPSQGSPGTDISGVEAGSRLDALLGSIADALITVDERGAMESVNPAAERLFGYRAADLLGASFPALFAGPDRDAYAGYVRDFGAGRPMPLLGSVREALGRRGDGSSFPIELTLTEVTLGDRMLVAVARDITERKHAEEQLRRLADFDPFTTLLNRRRFEQELDTHIDHSARYGPGGSVLVLDIDNFKNVNDSFGHHAGDELIGAVAGQLRARLRKTDLLARLGGDEFGMLLHGADAAKAMTVAEELRALIGNHPYVLGRQSVRVTVSVGVTTIGEEGITGAELIGRADHATIAAKEAGRDRIAEFDPDSRLQRDSGVVWSERVREAIDSGRFVLLAQPILDLAANEVSQHELLIRMRGDDGELVAPMAFLPTAERFGLVRGLDRWVAQHAIRLIASHQRAGRSLVLEVNLSGKTIEDQEFATAIGREIVQAGIEPSNLIFEVTEAAAVADLEQARKFAESMTRLGCGFALDDFGAGFASFYYLKHLPLHALKIDGEFVKDLPRTPHDQLIVKALVDVAEGMGMKTVAEFVEDEATLEILRGLGVTYAQGHHIGRPAPVGELSP
jgi:diguanylate cyclase (GGDEF)-like protein/PAS domain S-box-containing protein